MFSDLARVGKYLGQAARLMVGMPDYDALLAVAAFLVPALLALAGSANREPRLAGVMMLEGLLIGLVIRIPFVKLNHFVEERMEDTELM